MRNFSNRIDEGHNFGDWSNVSADLTMSDNAKADFSH